jgi:hypothetical protein
LFGCVFYLVLNKEPSKETQQTTSESGHIQAVGIPKQAEKLILFQDRGRVYTVGMESGQIRYVDAKTPNQP